MPYVTLPPRNKIPQAKIYYENESISSDLKLFDNKEINDESIKSNVNKINSKNNRPVMIMLPGGPGGTLNIYDAVRKDLSKYADLILLDPRGSGKSDESEACFCTIDIHIDDINVFCKSLKLEKPIIFGGSYGSMAALGYAIKYPDDLSKLICIAGSSHLDVDLARKNLLKYNATDDQLYWAEKLFNGDIKNLEESTKYYETMMPLYVFSKSALNNENNRTFEPKVRKRDTTHIFNAAFMEGGFLRTFDWRPHLHKIKVPTRLIFGDHDWINDSSLGLEIKELITSGGAPVDFIVLENCSHFQWLDQYDGFIHSVNEFVKIDLKSKI